MKTIIIQTTTKTLDENYTVLTTRTSEAYHLTPAEGMVLRHKPTGQVFPVGLCINNKQKIQEYEEITKDED